MPHQCVRCGKLYEDGANEILQGCSCGGKLFFFIRQERLKELHSATLKLSSSEKKQLEKDVLDIIGDTAEVKKEEPIVLDFESIRAMKPGVFELDLVALFNEKNPLVYKLAEGKYMIDIPETFARKKRMKRRRH